MIESVNKQTIAIKLLEIAFKHSISTSKELSEATEIVKEIYSDLFSVANGIPYSAETKAS